jgi:hypothetical protein
MKRPISPQLSRRHLIAGVAAAPLIGAAKPARQQHVRRAGEIAPATGPVFETARECLALHRESARRNRRYGDAEAVLLDNCRRLPLSKAHPRAQPEARQLRDMSDRLDFLWNDRPHKMRRLRNTRATSLEGVIGKLNVLQAAWSRTSLRAP